MDENKRDKLVALPYRILPVCGLCRHARWNIEDGGEGGLASSIRTKISQWSTCALHKYEHKKHGDERELSIHLFGSCYRFAMQRGARARLGAFAEFVWEQPIGRT